MEDVDKFLWPLDSKDLFTHSTIDWNEIASRLVYKLSDYLGETVLHEELNDEVDVGFSYEIWNDITPEKQLVFSWKGVLGCGLIDSENLCYMSIIADIFPYVNGKKVVTKDRGAFISHRYTQDADGSGIWICDGWQRDANYEFEYFDDDDERFVNSIS